MCLFFRSFFPLADATTWQTLAGSGFLISPRKITNKAAGPLRRGTTRPAGRPAGRHTSGGTWCPGPLSPRNPGTRREGGGGEVSRSLEELKPVL